MAEIKHLYTSPQADVGSTQLVQPSDWNSAHAFTMVEAVSAAVGVFSSGTLLFSNASGVSFGINAQTITASVKTDYQTSGAYLTTAMASNRASDFVAATAAFAGTSASGTIASNGISVSIGPYITTAMASNRGTDFVQATAGFNGTNCSGTIASNAISVSVGAYLTTAALSTMNIYASSNTYLTSSGSHDARSLSFRGDKSITIGISGSEVLFSVGAYITTGMLSARGTDFVQATAGFNGTNCSGTIASNSISVSVGNYITTADLSANSSKYVQAWELTGNTAGTTSSLQGTKLYFEGGNSLTVSGNSNTIKFSVGAYLTTAMASNRGTDFVQATAAFAGTNASGTIASGGISVSVAAPGAAAENNWFNITGNTSGDTSASGSTIMLSAINNLTISGTNGSVIVISGPTGGGAGISNLGSTAGTTGIASRQMVLVGTNGIVLSQSIDASNLSNTVTFDLRPASFFNFAFEPVAGTTAVTIGGSSMFVEPFYLPWPVSASFLRIPVSVAAFGSSTTGTTANRSWTFQEKVSYWANLYTQNVVASSRSLALLSQFSLSSLLQVVYRIGAASNNQTCSHDITYGATGASNAAFATNYNVNSGSANFSTTHLTAFTGIRFLDIPAAYLFTPGNYWLGLQQSSSTASTSAGGDWPTFTKNTSTASLIGISQVSANPNEMGANTTAGSNMWMGFGHGYWTTNSSGGTSSSLQMNQISTGANHPLVPFQLVRHA